MLPVFLTPGLDRITEPVLRTRRADLDVRAPDTPDALVDALENESDRIVLLSKNSTWEDEYLSGLSEGDWVQTTTSGYDAFPVDAFAERGVTFTNAPAVTAPAVAQHAFSLLFSITRQLDTFRAQRARLWKRRREHMTDLDGETCCVVGLGEIGERVAAAAAAFQMDVRGVKRSVKGYDGAAHEVFGTGDLHRALDGASVLVLACRLNDETRGLIGTDELDALAAGAIVVNVARGAILRTDALLDALDREQIGWAALDVTEEEPLPTTSPLWDRSDVLITPHNAGATDKFVNRMVEHFFEQYDRMRASDPLLNRVV